jgi:hypothetical protein
MITEDDYTEYMIWPDGTVAPLNDIESYSWKSDDFLVVSSDWPEDEIEELVSDTSKEYAEYYTQIKTPWETIEARRSLEQLGLELWFQGLEQCLKEA